MEQERRVENVIRMHGTGHKGRLPPMVSSLFSIKGRALARWYQRDRARSKGQGVDGTTAPRYPRKRLRLTRRGVEHEPEYEYEDEDED